MKIFQNSKKCSAGVLDNVVDKDVQSLLLPLNLMQYFSFCPKYRIKNNVITSNGVISNFVSLTVTLTFLLSFVFRTYKVELVHKDAGAPKFFYITSYYDAVYYCFGLCMNFVIGIIQSKKSVQFVLTFQRVHRFLNNESYFNQFMIWNWICVIVTLGIYVFPFTGVSIFLKLPFPLLFVCYYFIIFDFHILYTIRIIKLLENKMVLWSFQVLNSAEIEDVNEEKDHCSQMIQAYVDMLECYDIHKYCSQQFVSNLLQSHEF